MEAAGGGGDGLRNESSRQPQKKKLKTKKKPQTTCAACQIEGVRNYARRYTLENCTGAPSEYYGTMNGKTKKLKEFKKKTTVDI